MTDKEPTEQQTSQELIQKLINLEDNKEIILTRDLSTEDLQAFLDLPFEIAAQKSGMILADIKWEIVNEFKL